MASMMLFLSALLSVSFASVAGGALGSDSSLVFLHNEAESSLRPIHTLRKQQRGSAGLEAFGQLANDMAFERGAEVEVKHLAEMAYRRDPSGSLELFTHEPSGFVPLFLRCLCIVAIMAVVSFLTYLCFVSLGTIRHYEVQEVAKEKAIGFCFYTVFAEFVIFSSVIPDSLSWTLRIDDDSSAFSGYLIGAWMATTVFGYVLLTVMNRRQNNWSVMHMKSLNIVGGTISIGATLVFSVIVAHGEATSATLLPLAIARMVAGTGAGISLASTRVLAMKITDREDLVMCNARYTFYSILGTGLGPVAATVVKVLAELLVGHVFDYKVYSVWAIAGMHLVLNLTLLYGIWEFPQGCEELVVEGTVTPRDMPESTWGNHRRIIYCCVFITGARSMSAAGLEAATAMILETDFHWSQNLIGLVISASFLLCIPLRMAHEQFKNHCSGAAWLRINMGLSLFGCILFFESFGKWMSPSNPEYARLVCLIVGDCFLFPSMQYVGGLIEGTANSHCLPEETLFTITNIVLYCKVATNCVGHSLGPFTARWLLDNGRQDWYAAQQLFITILCVVVLEVGVFQQEHVLACIKLKDSD